MQQVMEHIGWVRSEWKHDLNNKRCWVNVCMRLADSDKDCKAFTENGTRHIEQYLHILYTFFMQRKELDIQHVT